LPFPSFDGSNFWDWRAKIDVTQKYMKMTKDAILEGSSQQANKDFINRRKEQGPKHLKFFLLVFSKDEAQSQ